MSKWKRLVLLASAVLLVVTALSTIALYIRLVTPSRDVVETIRSINEHQETVERRFASVTQPSRPRIEAAPNDETPPLEEARGILRMTGNLQALFNRPYLNPYTWAYSVMRRKYLAFPLEHFDPHTPPAEWIHYLSEEDLRNLFIEQPRSVPGIVFRETSFDQLTWEWEPAAQRTFHRLLDLTEKALEQGLVDYSSEREEYWSLMQLATFVVLRNIIEGDHGAANRNLESVVLAGLSCYVQEFQVPGAVDDLVLFMGERGIMENETAARIARAMDEVLVHPSQHRDYFLRDLHKFIRESEDYIRKGELTNSTWAHFLDGAPARAVNNLMQPVLINKTHELAAAIAREDPIAEEAAFRAFDRYSKLAGLQPSRNSAYRGELPNHHKPNPLVREYLPCFSTGIAAHNATIYRTMAVLAAVRYRQQTGQWPETANELVAGGFLDDEFIDTARQNWRFLEIGPFTDRRVSRSYNEEDQKEEVPFSRKLVVFPLGPSYSFELENNRGVMVTMNFSVLVGEANRDLLARASERGPIGMISTATWDPFSDLWDNYWVPFLTRPAMEDEAP